MLPKAQQMPLQEQMEAIGSTIPKEIDVQPTKDMAKLHSQLQKQLLGVEIVSPEMNTSHEKNRWIFKIFFNSTFF